MMFGHRRARRRFLLYLSGSLSPDAVRLLEKHLIGCAACRMTFARLKDGHRAAEKLNRIEKTMPLAAEEGAAAPAFTAALAEARGGRTLRRKWNGMRTACSLAFSAPRTVWILAAVVVLQAALLVVFNRNAPTTPRTSAAAAIPAIDFDQFRILDIAEIPGNSLPHIATEGYVRNVWMDEEEKTLHFKLAASPAGESPYVICEILNPGRIAAPRAGSRVRVYGLARYDAQIGRRWHEVNPVLNIDVLNR